MPKMEMTLLDYLLVVTGDNSHKESLISQLCLAVSYMHSKGFMHRDISLRDILVSTVTKSENPLRSSESVVLKLADFGLAKEIYDTSGLDDYQSHTQEICTVLYKAPEIAFLSGKYNQKIDVWSCAIILYYILFKKHPFKGFIELDNEEYISILFEYMGVPDPDFSTRGWKNFPVSEIPREGKGFGNFQCSHPKYFNIFTLMTKYLPSERIKMKKVVKKLLKSC